MPTISRSRKMIRKPKVVRKRKVSSRKPVRKSAAAPVAKALSTIAVHHNTMLKSLFDHVYYEYKRCNESEVGLGYHTLFLDTTTPATKFLPLHIYDLTSIVTDAIAAPAYLQMFLNGNDYPYFVKEDLITQLGVNDGGGVVTTQSHNRTVQEYFDVRLELFGRNTKKTVWDVMLLKLFDEDMAPIYAADTTKNKHNNFWKQLARPYYTNPLVPSDSRIMADMKGKFKVMWQKTYTFRDKDSSFDEVQRKTVKIFKKLNQLNKYNETPDQKTYAGDDPNEQVIPLAAGSTSPVCQLPNRWYLVIRANQTQDWNQTVGTTWDPAAGATAINDICSYNIYYRTKHMVPALAQ